MVHFKIRKNLPLYISKLFPELFGVRSYCDDEEFIVLIYETNTPVGCCLCQTEDPVIDKEGNIKINIKINRFEIRKSKQRKGYGTQLFNWVVTKFNVHKVSLLYLDDNAKKFWKAMGFHKESGHSDWLYKIIK